MRPSLSLSTEPELAKADVVLAYVAMMNDGAAASPGFLPLSSKLEAPRLPRRSPVALINCGRLIVRVSEAFLFHGNIEMAMEQRHII